MNVITKEYGLVGHPLGHSFSHDYFEEKFRREGINATYLNLDLDSASDFPSLLRETIETHPDLIGFNVTIPYKEKILECLDSVDAQAGNIGAVNVVRIIRDAHGRCSSLAGYNTDITGFTESLRPFVGRQHRKALILGTGGAAKAVRHGLLSLGIEATFVSRFPSEGQLSYAQLTAETISDHLVIVNATPLGMYPKTENSPDIPYENLSPDHICFDLVYNPAKTRFMELAEQQGATVINGLEMLHIQADEAWKIWNRQNTIIKP